MDIERKLVILTSYPTDWLVPLGEEKEEEKGALLDLWSNEALLELMPVRIPLIRSKSADIDDWFVYRRLYQCLLLFLLCKEKPQRM